MFSEKFTKKKTCNIEIQLDFVLLCDCRNEIIINVNVMILFNNFI